MAEAMSRCSCYWRRRLSMTMALLTLGTLLNLQIVCASAYLVRPVDVRILCNHVTCLSHQECRVQMPCLGPRCKPMPVCTEVSEYLDTECPNNTQAVVVSAKSSLLPYDDGQTDLDTERKLEAMSCLDMLDCPEGSVCVMDVCCYD